MVGWRGGDFRRRLRRQGEPELVDEQTQLGLRLGVAREHEFAAVGGWDVDVDHLHGGEFVEHAARREARRQGGKPPPQRDVQGIGQEGDEDVRLDARLMLMEDRPDSEIAFEGLEGLLHCDELQIV